MWCWLLLTTAIPLLSNTGHFINTHSSDSNRRIRELLNESIESRQIADEWDRRIWFTEQPSHLPPERLHGGIE